MSHFSWAWFQGENYRKKFTDTLKDCLDMGNFKYPLYTDKVYISIFREKAKEYRKILRLHQADKVRDTIRLSMSTKRPLTSAVAASWDILTWRSSPVCWSTFKTTDYYPRIEDKLTHLFFCTNKFHCFYIRNEKSLFWHLKRGRSCLLALIGDRVAAHHQVADIMPV